MNRRVGSLESPLFWLTSSVHNLSDDGRDIRRDLPVQPRVSIPEICFEVLTEQSLEMSARNT